jgi:hypothetical protein
MTVICIIGDVGSGKSLFSVRRILKSNRMVFTNFNVKAKNVIRLKKADVIQAFDKDSNELQYPLKRTDKGICYMVNWDFWEKVRKMYKNYDIYLDEVNNIFMARKAMTGYNCEGIKWISQIRKILSDSTTSNIILISQRLERIDVAWRDLIQEVIFVHKMPLKGKTIIMAYHFITDMRMDAVNKYESFKAGYKTYSKRYAFDASLYFKFYDTYQIIKESEYL